MSADLHIHVLEGVTEPDLASFKSTTLGSKYFNLFAPDRADTLYERMGHTPNVWVGEVSWLKAGIFDDAKTYIPDPVMRVSEVVGEELPVITDEFIAQIAKAMDVENTTSYKIADTNTVTDFLRKHHGKQVFTISW